MRPADHNAMFARQLLLLLLALMLLPACSLSTKKVGDVDARIYANRETGLSCLPREINRCADASPLLDFGKTATRAGRHHLTLVEFGEDALLLRIHMIRAAQRYIELQNFILRGDDTGVLVLNELLNAARRGVKVRLLLDQMFSFSDVEYLVHLAMDHSNFEIRFYNPSFYKAEMAKHDWVSGIACCFRRVNQRMHNKLLVADDVAGLLGGRNIADRYFDYDTNYNFKDRDVLVFGVTARQMRESFDWFWEGPRTVPVQHLRDVAAQILKDEPSELESFQPAPRLGPLLEQAADPGLVAERFVEPAMEVKRLEYFSDLPRKHAFPDEATPELITQQLYDVLLSARQSVVIQSPYMVLSRRARKVFRELRDNNPDIELIFSTNSLASTDADTVYANTHRHKKRYVKRIGFQMYEFKPFPLDAPDFFPRWPRLLQEKKRGIKSKSVVSGDNSVISMPAPRSGLHSKSFVVDGKVSMIGSHNFDPRSEGFNTENGLIVWDETFARKLEQLIRRDIEPQNSWVVAMKPDTEQSKTAMAPVPKTMPEFKPWSYSSTSVYELAEGREPLPPGSPDFYRNYYAVGSFPEVVRTRRQITVVFLSSFFFFLEPVL
ncbi:MAG: phospholipase D family protein [Xanthomonadales bacterium]|nr:phospholipase D family protein [Xanthomonadales bacterium]